MGGGKTFIGDNNLFMVYVHVAHDCIIGITMFLRMVLHLQVILKLEITLFSAACLVVTNLLNTVIGLWLQQAQRLLRMFPFCMVHGDRAKINGLNVIGLRRSGLSRESIKQIKEMYK